MVYFTIRLLTASQDMMTIVTGFGKFKYISLPMDMCALEEILQAKVDEVLGDIKGVNTYINDILVLYQKSYSKQIEQLRIVFGELCSAGLKVNAPKCSFGIK